MRASKELGREKKGDMRMMRARERKVEGQGEGGWDGRRVRNWSDLEGGGAWVEDGGRRGEG